MSTRKALLTGAMIVASTGPIGLSSSPALACDDQPLLGSVCWMAGNYCPRNYVAADGRTLSITEFTALYALFSTTYGGDGRTTFAVPDLRGRAAMGAGRPFPTSAASPATLALGQKVGAEGVVLTQATMPTHTHAATFSGVSSTVTVQPNIQAVGATPTPATSMAPSSATPYLAGVATSGRVTQKMWVSGPVSSPANVGGLTLNVSALPPAAGGASVTNAAAGAAAPKAVPTVSPELVLTACVATVGIFPPQPQ